MLWYKYWLESRSRFVISMMGITGICSLYLFHWDREASFDTNNSYFNYGIGETHGMLVYMWLLAVTLLMMGGLLPERSNGSSAFTLALPISRSRLMTARLCIGLCQAAALAIVPWAIMYLIANEAGRPYALSQAADFLFLLFAGGLVFFSIAVLASCTVEGEYTAPLASIGGLILLTTVFSVPLLRPYSPLRFMLGLDYLDPHSNLISLSVPWVQGGVYTTIAVLFLILSVKLIEKREF